jgi:GNAT superfamily N-acetyltransferase
MIERSEFPRLRSLIGETTKLWAGESGVDVEPGRYAALSGAPSVDYNVVVCHGASDGTQFPRSLDEIGAVGAPALIMVADAALGEVQQLVEAGWVCIGQTAFIGLELEPWSALEIDPHVRKLEPSELEAARALTDEVFGIGPELARIAIPDDAGRRPGQTVWGAFDDDGELVTPLISVRAQEAVGLWGIATPARHRFQGHARRVMTAALSDAAREGARIALGHTTPDGEAFNTSLGWEILERWQQWSRPRWVLGRA